MNTDDSVVSISSSASRKSSPPKSPSGTAKLEPKRGERIPDMATMDMAMALPSLPDDADIGIVKEHIVRRDGDRDLKFKGTLLASVAPPNENRGRWHELRVYKTLGGKTIFSHIGRSVLEGERDKFTAHFFDPDRATSGRPWYETPEDKIKAESDSMTTFFEFGELAKKLYAKLAISTEETLD